MVSFSIPNNRFGERGKIATEELHAFMTFSKQRTRGDVVGGYRYNYPNMPSLTKMEEISWLKNS